MPPPEVWGPAVWTLFHALAEKINVNAYPYVFPSLFNIIVKISKYLPCPECANDASIFLAKVKVSELKTKDSLKAMLCVFHNTVNAKKRKPIFHYSNIGIYGKYNLIKELFPNILEKSEELQNILTEQISKGNLDFFSKKEFPDFLAHLQREVEKIVIVKLTVALKFKEPDLKAMASLLSEKIGKPVAFQLTVDRSLIGGAIIQYGNYLSDYSIRTKLGEFKEQWHEAINEENAS